MTTFYVPSIYKYVHIYINWSVYGVFSTTETEAVPSINYPGRQLDVYYIGREMYGEILRYLN